MGLNQDELLKAFVDEALEHLSTIEADFLEIEKKGAIPNASTRCSEPPTPSKGERDSSDCRRFGIWLMPSKRF